MRSVISRGYEHFEKKLQGLGAVIEKVDSEKEAQKFVTQSGLIKKNAVSHIA